MRKASILAALLLLTPAVSQAKTLEDLLVEKGVITKGEATNAMGGAPAKVYYNDGTRLDFSDAGVTAKINTLIQTRYVFTDNEEGTPNTSSFEVKNARLMVSGNALHDEFGYMVSGDFAGDDDHDGNKTGSLKDAYIKWNACDWGSVKMGQFKTGISRQFVTPDQNHMFADDSGVSQYFSKGRNQGLQGSADLADGALTVGAGIFNGESDGEGINSVGKDTNHMGVVNLRWNAMGKMDSYSEGDVDWTENTAVSFGAAYAASSQKTAVGNATDTWSRNTVNVDGNLKVMGFGLNAEYYVEDIDSDLSDDSVTPQGFYAQVGYFLKPKKLELAARYGYLDCDNGQAPGSVCTGFDNVNEVTGGINYYWMKHNLKAQLNYSLMNQDVVGGSNDNEVNTNRWLFQLTSYL